MFQEQQPDSSLCLQLNKNVQSVFMTSHRISHRAAQKEFISFWVSPQLILLQSNFTSDAPCRFQSFSQTPACPSAGLPAPQECWQAGEQPESADGVTVSGGTRVRCASSALPALGTGSAMTAASFCIGTFIPYGNALWLTQNQTIN